MKRYKLICPSCMEEQVALPAGRPDEPWCIECDEEIKIEKLKEMVNSWGTYLVDREILLKSEENKSD